MIREHELRLVWQFQQLESTRLRTTDGRRVAVCCPGTPNMDGGPDFRNARIRIGETTFVGDVEVHIRSAEWVAHHHHLDSHYNRVVLHVVLVDDGTTTRTASRRAIPVVALRECVDTTLPAPPPLPSLQQLPTQGIEDLIKELAAVRIEKKILRLHERLREIIDEQRMVLGEPRSAYGMSSNEIPLPAREYSRQELISLEAWEQLEYEGIMEAMGYSKNRVPCARLARAIRLWMLRRFGLEDTSSTMALLFGAAGLLPPPRRLPDREIRSYVRGLSRRWAELRPAVRSMLLHEADWLFFRLRPANFPTARLASMCFLLPGLFASHGVHTLLMSSAGSPGFESSWMRSVRALFSFSPDEFWACHYSFARVRGRRGIRLGRDRILDIAANILIPAAILYSRLAQETTSLRWGVELLESLPPGPTNATLRLLTTRSGLGFVPNNALMYQGAMELGERLKT